MGIYFGITTISAENIEKLFSGDKAVREYFLGLDVTPGLLTSLFRLLFRIKREEPKINLLPAKMSIFLPIKHGNRCITC